MEIKTGYLYHIKDEYFDVVNDEKKLIQKINGEESQMNDRITLIALFNDNELFKIKTLLNNTDELLCKVPFGKNVIDRYIVDTLPFHFTLSAWAIENEEYIINELSKLSFNKFRVIADGIDIMKGKENSYVLYIKIKENEELRNLQKQIYNILPSEKYNPENFQFHITITIDKDIDKIKKLKQELNSTFIPIEFEVQAMGLFEIYPAKIIKKFYSIN